MSEHYIPAETYRLLTAALTSIKPCPLSGMIEPHQFAEALGEIGGIWPDSVLNDSANDRKGTASSYRLTRANIPAQN